MNLATFPLLKRGIEPDWNLINDDVPLGRAYIADLDNIRQISFDNPKTGGRTSCTAIFVLSPGSPGYMPTSLFGMTDLPPTPASETFLPLSNEHISTTCHIGQGPLTCSFIGKQSDFFFCTKNSSLEAVIRQRLSDGTMGSLGDHCSGPPDFKPYD